MKGVFELKRIYAKEPQSLSFDMSLHVVLGFPSGGSAEYFMYSSNMYYDAVSRCLRRC